MNLKEKVERYLNRLRNGCSSCDFEESNGELFAHCNQCKFELTGLGHEIFIQEGVQVGGGGKEKVAPEFSNGLTKAQEEMLQILEEECAELIQAVSKIRRHGMNDKSRISNLYEEAGDVIAGLGMLTHNCLLDVNLVNRNARAKLNRIREPDSKRVHYITPDMVP